MQIGHAGNRVGIFSPGAEGRILFLDTSSSVSLVDTDALTKP